MQDSRVGHGFCLANLLGGIILVDCQMEHVWHVYRLLCACQFCIIIWKGEMFLSDERHEFPERMRCEHWNDSDIGER